MWPDAAALIQRQRQGKLCSDNICIYSRWKERHLSNARHTVSTAKVTGVSWCLVIFCKNKLEWIVITQQSRLPDTPHIQARRLAQCSVWLHVHLLATRSRTTPGPQATTHTNTSPLSRLTFKPGVKIHLPSLFLHGPARAHYTATTPLFAWRMLKRGPSRAVIKKTDAALLWKHTPSARRYCKLHRSPPFISYAATLFIGFIISHTLSAFPPATAHNPASPGLHYSSYTRFPHLQIIISTSRNLCLHERTKPGVIFCLHIFLSYTYPSKTPIKIRNSSSKPFWSFLLYLYQPYLSQLSCVLRPIHPSQRSLKSRLGHPKYN